MAIWTLVISTGRYAIKKPEMRLVEEAEETWRQGSKVHLVPIRYGFSIKAG
jgi:hypothetical protein